MNRVINVFLALAFLSASVFSQEDKPHFRFPEVEVIGEERLRNILEEKLSPPLSLYIGIGERGEPLKKYLFTKLFLERKKVLSLEKTLPTARVEIFTRGGSYTSFLSNLSYTKPRGIKEYSLFKMAFQTTQGHLPHSSKTKIMGEAENNFTFGANKELAIHTSVTYQRVKVPFTQQKLEKIFLKGAPLFQWQVTPQDKVLLKLLLEYLNFLKTPASGINVALESKYLNFLPKGKPFQVCLNLSGLGDRNNFEFSALSFWKHSPPFQALFGGKVTFKTRVDIFPTLILRYLINDRSFIEAILKSKLHYPRFSPLYLKKEYTWLNPTLKTALEKGVYLKSHIFLRPEWEVNLNFAFKKIEDLINWQEQAKGIFKPINIPEVIEKAISLEVIGQLFKGLKQRVCYQLKLPNQKLLFYPQHILSLDFIYYTPLVRMVELKWKLESSQFSNNKKLPAQGKVDLEFQHPFRGFLLWGRIENLLRSNYVSPFGFPAPGVNFLIGFKTKF